MPEVGGGLLLVLGDPTPGHEQDLEDWYEHQHLYERSAIEGFLFSRRYLSVKGEPLSLALYELEDAGVVRRAPYLDAMQNERARNQARAQRTGSRWPGGTVNSLRNEYELVASAG